MYIYIYIYIYVASTTRPSLKIAGSKSASRFRVSGGISGVQRYTSTPNNPLFLRIKLTP